MENEFSLRVLQQQTNQTFPVRINPLSLTNKQLLNKIRINHQKLPSQFFANPKSMPDLSVPALRTPALESRKHRENRHFDEQTLQSKLGARSLRNYRSEEQNRQQRQRELQVNSLFRQHDELGITFSRLPIRKVQNNAKKLHEFYSKSCLKRVSTEPCCEANHVLANLEKEDFGGTVKIGNFIPSQKGISIRKNNHPLSTLREIKKQRQ